MRLRRPARLVPFLALTLLVAGIAPAAGRTQPHAGADRAPESPVRGLPGDWWADVIVGHPAFSEITPNLVNPLPAARVKDYQSMPYAAAFDEGDNLYLVDLNRHRVLIYWQPDVTIYSAYVPLIVKSGP